MRALLTFIAGGPGRVAITATAVVVITFVLAGAGWDLARAAWTTTLFAAGFTFAFAVLALIGAATGASDEAPVAAPKEADRGHG
ncbi:hypothetical protein [Methylobacterium gregans]|uniref:Uncharacterized protein n=1 Tax=Methylobacterium gregans TaxID=374424 RepID=A0AA37HPV9_9HYPH|nr:hypothetical protein [Methylobacterium gregans]MDQ0522426.1 hypothetical protein [Methylobacterium gregans]GJD79570.1 hypothetical protein NBEOAGPD_2799 [Methylobacterium gregans]GLS55172.1 hypothetical protein GCM10007886_33560 [Methylobacterium gregans]